MMPQTIDQADIVQVIGYDIVVLLTSFADQFDQGLDTSSASVQGKEEQVNHMTLLKYQLF